MATEKPILFSGPLVRAILDGRKSVTRRVVKARRSDYGFVMTESVSRDPSSRWPMGIDEDEGFTEYLRCPYGKPGDRLYVREAFEYTFGDSRDGLVGVRYAADGASGSAYVDEPERYIARIDGRKRPSIHMPHVFSRLKLEVTEIGVERVQEITEADCVAEGIDLNPVSDHAGARLTLGSPRGTFAALWEKINGPRGYGWDANPWVWVVRFRRVDA